KPYSEETAGKIDDEVRRLIDEAYERCRSILVEHDDKLEAVAQFLLSHNTMSRTQFNACMNGEPIPETESESIFDRFAELDRQDREKQQAGKPAQPEEAAPEAGSERDTI
ncbi:MAG: hypothetical protein II769_04300, partial [Oscillospiraceae bacterium]|nr:hypothetical protein [Oscillospiraceae bacterium]